MERQVITHTDGNLHIEGFPDAVKLATLGSPEARRLAHLMLHKTDLEFARECVAALRNEPPQPSVIREALWRSAVVAWAKCFGSSNARVSLNAQKIYTPGIQQEVCRYFLALRNKHFVHDDNSYSQALPGAIIGPAGSPKIQKIICLEMIAMTGTDESELTNLELLIKTALNWVIQQFDVVADLLTQQLEALDYSDLLALPDMTVSKPTVDQIAITRA